MPAPPWRIRRVSWMRLPHRAERPDVKIGISHPQPARGVWRHDADPARFFIVSPASGFRGIKGDQVLLIAHTGVLAFPCIRLQGDQILRSVGFRCTGFRCAGKCRKSETAKIRSAENLKHRESARVVPDGWGVMAVAFSRPGLGVVWADGSIRWTSEKALESCLGSGAAWTCAEAVPWRCCCARRVEKQRICCGQGNGAAWRARKFEGAKRGAHGGSDPERDARTRMNNRHA